MSRRIRRFLLAVTSVCPPLHRRLRRYFVEHPEYEFVFECNPDGLGPEAMYRQREATFTFFLSRMVSHYKNEPDELFAFLADHEQMHRVFHKLGLQREFIRWYELFFGGFPHLETLLDIEEHLVRLFLKEAHNWCGVGLPDDRYPLLIKPPAWLHSCRDAEPEPNKHCTATLQKFRGRLEKERFL